MAQWQGERVVQLAGSRGACSDCSLFNLCLPKGLDNEHVQRLDVILQRQRPLARGDVLYREGDEFRTVYAVRAGSLKTYTISREGEEQVTGFHMPGEMLGLDAVSLGAHPCEAKALETSSICELPFHELEELARAIPALQRQLLRLMSKEIFQDHEMLHALARRNAEERLAILLLNFSQRFARRGLSATRFRLPMSRSDLSNYLGLAPETMSRLFKRFQGQGWLHSRGKEITLKDMASLERLAGHCQERPCDRPDLSRPSGGG
ncbi:fumarate/nitrate reduction transcriptional regulator Fnr [Alkalilimnicola ehrlichii]|uniref:fumarate/nitrate reduction transcriptional regulator Fnr n=1 Tax=Alkalilimnicola ehrlichii TaxID=351052 RepID=UPI003BA0200F